MANTALSGKVAKIRTTAISPTSSTGEAATLVSATSGDYVYIDDTTKRHFDRNVSTGFSLYLNTTAVSSTAYDVNYVQGRFEFHSTGQSTGTYTMDVEYLTTSYLGRAKSWDATVSNDVLDITTFATATGSAQWRNFTAGLSGWTANISKLISTGDTGPTFYDHLNLPNDILVSLHVSDASWYEGYGYVNSDGWETAVDGLGMESVTIQGDGRLYRTTST